MAKQEETRPHVLIPSPESMPLSLPVEDDMELFIGHTPLMRRIMHMAYSVAGTTQTNVLLQGESGTGKDLMARAIHRLSHRSQHPFIAINCAALAPQTAEAELFGSEAGAFAEAKFRRGLVELANEGTLFLDEIGELPPPLQPVVLRFLEKQEYHRIGSVVVRHVNVRVISATAHNVNAAIQNGTFRSDLYHRLSTFILTLPPLRERTGDIAELSQMIVERLASKLAYIFDPDDAFDNTPDWQVGDVVLHPETIDLLQRYTWPGNIRQLYNALEFAMIVGRQRMILPEHLPEYVMNEISQELHGATAKVLQTVRSIQLPENGINLKAVVQTLEDTIVQQALRKCSGNLSQAAQLLGISRDQMRVRVQRKQQ